MTLYCANCGEPRAVGETCPECELMNDPLPLTPEAAKKARARWRRDERRYKQIVRRSEALKRKLGPEAYSAFVDAELRGIGV